MPKAPSKKKSMRPARAATSPASRGALKAGTRRAPARLSKAARSASSRQLPSRTPVVRQEPSGGLMTHLPRHIAIMYRPNTSAAMTQARELATWLFERGYEVYSAPGQTLGKNCHRVTPTSLDRIDLVIVLGGDGTYLGAVRMLGDRQIPILGVNMGNLGFLTTTRLADLYKVTLCALEGKLELRPRSMLYLEVRRAGKVRLAHVALNDVIIERGGGTHLLNFAILSQKNPVGEIKADAVIIASPTGSTAYSLAAGGPILHPDVSAIVVTPVCPHSLTTRPVIFPDDQEIVIRMLSKDRHAVLNVDGVNRGEITCDDEVFVVRHKIDHFVLRKPSHNYFTLLREKLKFGQRD